MDIRRPQKESRIEQMEKLWFNFVAWRRENIRKSLIRPLYQEAIRTLFLAGCLLIDSLLPLQLFVSLASPYNIIGALIVLIILLYFEVRYYNAIWGKQGRWSIEKYKKSIENIIEEKKK